MRADTLKDVTLTVDNGVAKISINRPDKLNAICIQTYHDLITAFKAADLSEDCRIILLTGEGGNFTAGNDLSDLAGDKRREVMVCVQSIFETVANLKKVLIGKVEGVAVGIGTTILLHCDLVVAARETKFRLPFANLGVCPEGGSSQLLPDAIGQKNARELLLTGRFFTADEALTWGLINRVVEKSGLENEVDEYINSLLKQPLESLLSTKELMKTTKGNVGEIVASELNHFSRLLESEETSKRILSLLKR